MKYLLFLILMSVSVLSYAQEQGYVTSQGVSMHYKTFGKGLPLLLINGGPGMSSEGFIPLAEQLGEKYYTILFDQRGTGLSNLDRLDNSTVSMDLMLEDMEALRKHLELESWVLMGHSFGGMLASYYASKYPERVQAMILSSSGGVDLELLSSVDIRAALTDMQRDSLAYWSARISNGDTSYHARLQRGKYLAPAYLYDDKHVTVIAERLTQGNMQLNGIVWNDMRRMGFDCKEELKNFQAPVLILHGKQDIVDESIPRKAKALFPNARLVILDRCAHYGWLDRPKAYFQEIEAFLSESKI
jgi:proline iminopeptidase